MWICMVLNGISFYMVLCGLTAILHMNQLLRNPHSYCLGEIVDTLLRLPFYLSLSRRRRTSLTTAENLC